MSVFRMTASEFFRVRRTGLLLFHILLPLAGLFLFGWYLLLTQKNPEIGIQIYFQTAVFAIPLLIGIFCGIAVEQEEKNHFQVFLMLGSQRWKALLAKWLMLFLLYTISVLIGIGGFSVFLQLSGVGMLYTSETYACLCALLLPGGSFLIVLHLFLGLRFGMALSISAGIFEMLMAGLFLTGLGDVIWPFCPFVWAGRWMGPVISWGENRHSYTGDAAGVLQSEAGVCAAVWLIGVGLIFVWFYRFEGRREDR